jgi:putative peptide zinc metalloprotease protein
VHRGEAFGYILDRSPLRLRAAVPETAAALLRSRLYGAEARFADDPSRRHPAEVVRDMPAAVRELPATALGTRGAGSLETDPLDERGLRTAVPFVHVEVRVAAPTTVRVEGLAWVRFDHGWSTVAAQGLRALRQVFLRRFEAGT